MVGSIKNDKGSDKLRVVIAGSRDFSNYELLKTKTIEVFKQLKAEGFNTKRENIEIVSGTAKGADILGEQFAKDYNIKVKRFPADWSLGEKSRIFKESKHGIIRKAR